MTAIRHVLEDVVSGRYDVTATTLEGLERALDAVLELAAEAQEATA